MRVGKKYVMGMSWVCHGLRHRNRFRINSYDDLLSAMHRWFAQIALGASGQSSKDASAVERVVRRRPARTLLALPLILRNRVGRIAPRGRLRDCSTAEASLEDWPEAPKAI